MVGGSPGKRLGVRGREGGGEGGEEGGGGACAVFSTPVEGRVDETHTSGFLLEQAVALCSLSLCSNPLLVFVSFSSLWSPLVRCWSCWCGFSIDWSYLGFLELSLLESVRLRFLSLAALSSVSESEVMESCCSC